MDQDKNKNPGGTRGSGSGGTGGTSGWSPTSQPGPAAGSKSISQSGSAGDSSRDFSGGNRLGSAIDRSEDHGDSGNLRDRAMQRGSGMLHEVQGKVNEGVEQGKGRIASEISAMGGALREAAGKLEDRDSGIGRYASMAADQIESLGDFVRDADPNEMLMGVQRFARRRPELFLGGAIIAGLLLGRFLRSHEPRRSFDRRYDLDDTRDEDYSDNFSTGRLNRGYASAAATGTSATGYGSATGSQGTGGLSGGTGYGTSTGSSGLGTGPASRSGSGFSTSGGTGGTGYGTSGSNPGTPGSAGKSGYGDNKGTGGPRPSGST